MNTYRYKKYRSKRSPKKRIITISGLVFKSRVFWDIVLISILVLGIVYLIFFSLLFRIKEVSVFAPDLFLQKEAGAFALRKLGENIIFLSAGEIKKWFAETFSQIEIVEVRRRLPDGFVLTIEKKTPAVLWCKSREDCAFLDKNGALFWDKEFKSPESLPAVILGESNLKDYNAQELKEIAGKITEINQGLAKNINIEPVAFTIEENGELAIATSEGWVILISLSSELDPGLARLKLLLEKELPLEQRKNLNYIDLRFSKIYYK